MLSDNNIRKEFKQDKNNIFNKNKFEIENNNINNNDKKVFIKKDTYDSKIKNKNELYTPTPSKITINLTSCEKDLDNFLKDNEQYKILYKMLKAGVPSIGVMHKAKLNGLDMDIFEQLLEKANKVNPSIEIIKISKKVDEKKEIESPEKQLENFLLKNEDFRTFYKMLKLGVPLNAIELKAKINGYDMNILEQLIEKVKKVNPKIH